MLLALTVAVTSVFTVAMPIEAEVKTNVSKVKVNIIAPKKINAKLSTAKGGYDDLVILRSYRNVASFMFWDFRLPGEAKPINNNTVQKKLKCSIIVQ